MMKSSNNIRSNQTPERPPKMHGFFRNINGPHFANSEEHGYSPLKPALPVLQKANSMRRANHSANIEELSYWRVASDK
jgi:hypothetical protein